MLAYLALGSNLGDRVGTLIAAREAICSLPTCALSQASSLYESAAWGSTEPQPNYLNAVLAIATGLQPLLLWQHVAAIEQAHGRIRGVDKNAPRTLDIDLLLYDDLVLNTINLVLPHPRLHLRKFVLQPLLEIAPTLVIPGLGSAAGYLAQLLGDDARQVSQNSAWN